MWGETAVVVVHVGVDCGGGAVGGESIATTRALAGNA